ncbi:MAG: hypothetical protein H0X33_04650 [Taibaiella sp.]|nr:hypothetical protein [Taibaiella sp.]
MKYLVIIMLLSLGLNRASAQEVYNSSGHKNYKQKKVNKGFDPSKLVYGGGAVAGFGNGYADLGISPMIGYKFTNDFIAGIGLGYEYLKVDQQVYDQSTGSYFTAPAKANIIYPGVWARYFVYRGSFGSFFVEGNFEYDLMYFSAYNYDNNYNPVAQKASFQVPCLLMGGGLSQPVSDRVSLLVEVLYDVLQQQNSPYLHIPVIRGGIVVGF